MLPNALQIIGDNTFIRGYPITKVNKIKSANKNTIISTIQAVRAKENDHHRVNP